MILIPICPASINNLSIKTCSPRKEHFFLLLSKRPFFHQPGNEPTIHLAVYLSIHPSIHPSIFPPPHPKSRGHPPMVSHHPPSTHPSTGPSPIHP